MNVRRGRYEAAVAALRAMPASSSSSTGMLDVLLQNFDQRTELSEVGSEVERYELRLAIIQCRDNLGLTRTVPFSSLVDGPL